MKKIYFLICCLLCLVTGCEGERVGKAYFEDAVEEVYFTLPEETVQAYKKQVQALLETHYWKYNRNMFLYEQIKVPSKEDDLFIKIQEASQRIQLSIEEVAGAEGVAVMMELQHFNNDKAGMVHAYFVKDQVVGIFYTVDYDPEQVYSLKDRNVFTSKVRFGAYENKEKSREFMQINSVQLPKSPISGIGTDQRGRRMIAMIHEGEVRFYTYGSGRFNLASRFSMLHYNLEPMGLIFYRNSGDTGDTCAVLMGERIIKGQEEEHVFMASRKVVFLKDTFYRIEDELTLSSEEYSAVYYDQQQLILTQGKSVEYYEYKQGSWNKNTEIAMGHNVQQFIQSDLDVDGIIEYIMTDGLDLYIYHKKNKGFKNIWRTHLSIESIGGNIYPADLNGDGVQELYVSDSTGTVIRYILTEKGVVSYNEDIEYGQQYFTGDFNGDGRDDYIKMEDIEEKKLSAFIAK